MRSHAKVWSSFCVVALAVGGASPAGAWSREVAVSSEKPELSSTVQAKPLSQTVHAGLAWIVKHQLPDGGWGQGEESVAMGQGNGATAQSSNVADTAMSTLALLRAGSSPTHGTHAAQIRRAVDYVLREIEASDQNSLYVTQVRGTRVQSKIGPYVDTFLSAQLLAEVDGTMGHIEKNARVRKALDKVLAKMDRNQQSDGGYSTSGWAPVLSEAIAAKSVNRAAQKGARVSEQARERTENWALQKYDAKSGRFDGAGSAGVDLYAGAASVGAMQDADQSNDMEVAELERDARDAPRAEDRAQAEKKLERFARTKAAKQQAQRSIVARLQDPSFAAGFGSNGGEEFLSYMLLSESLVVQGGTAWEQWDAEVTANLDRVQNADGSWSGHHCITGRSFCTSAALLVLLADRAPAPLADAIRHG